MRLLARLVLRHRARQSVLNALRFAERLRKQNSEFAPSYSDTLEAIGAELASLVRSECTNDGDRRAVMGGLLAAFQRMYKGNPQLAQRIVRRLAPRILTAESVHEPASAAMRIAV
jgi:hypothetical protein